MNKKKPLITKTLFILFALAIVFICNNCKNDNKHEKTTTKSDIDTSGVLIKYNNTLFTIPSPYQASYAIKDNNIAFNSSLLNSPDNYSNYTTNFTQALNIGIYGTDLGYLNAYEQSPKVISYFSTIKRLSKELRIQSAIRTNMIERIENNIEAPDSLLLFMSDTYRQFNVYLQNNNRNDIGVLIITGGWIESLYILSVNAVEQKDRSIINRLGEQKHPLDNLIELLSPYYYKSEIYSNLIDSLVDLAYEFDGIIYNYSYEEPIIYPKKKLTIINSKSNIIISEYHLRTISNKISSIRNSIIH
ncbi:MAG: hypothetical protein U9R54_06475 [Bacteroidota bacterium]|nr:hypothetical protein [Bacteroidota bacterium]